MLDRRQFLVAGGASIAASLATGGAAFASLPGNNRLVFVILRGGLDGLHTLIPAGDKRYSALRPTISAALERAGGVTMLDRYFGLHHALAPLLPLYDEKELLFLPAAATVYRSRSHFDGQNVLENGSGKPYGTRTGWLNRAIGQLTGGEERLGLSIGPAVPLILQGDARVQTWSDSRLPDVDEDFLLRMARSYKDDTLFAATLDEALSASEPDIDMAGMRRGRGENFQLSARAAADLLAQEAGPRIGVLELGGWDTHFDQERRLTQLFQNLSAGIVEFKQGLGKHWQSTAIVVVSEFGRTAAENASRGTDHGTGGIAMLAGGAVNGGRIIGDWPGLNERDLWEGRDLAAVNSYESLFKGVLLDHLSVGANVLNNTVFPESKAMRPTAGLFKSV